MTAIHGGTVTTARVLVVEDEGLVALALEQCLVGIGHQVVARVATGEEAVRAATELEPDVILMDIRLQGAMDGIEAAERIHRASMTPIIYLTAYSSEQILARARTTEPFGYLLKPFSDNAVRSAIEITLHNAVVQAGVRRSRELFRATLEGISEAVVTTDPRGVITFANANAEDLLRRPAAELVGKLVQRVLRIRVEEGAKEIMIPTARVLSERKGLNLVSLLLETRDAEPVWIDLNLAPLQSVGGSVTGLAISFHRSAA